MGDIHVYSVASLQQEINLLKEQIDSSNSKSSYDIYTSTDEENLKEILGSDYTESINGNLLDYNELLVENSKLNKDISDLTTNQRNQQNEIDQLKSSNNDTTRIFEMSGENNHNDNLLQMEQLLD